MLAIKTIYSSEGLPLIQDDDTLLREEFSLFNDRRNMLEKIWDLVCALFNDIRFTAQFTFGAGCLERTIQKKVFWRPTEQDVTAWNVQSCGVAFFLHGIGEKNPYIWMNHIQSITKACSEMDLRAFYIPKRGECANEEAIADIVKVIRDYVQTNPGKPITLYGVSNGARLLLHVDEALSDLENTPIYFQSIAGPHFGTCVMDMAERVLQCFGKNRDAINELKFNADRELIKRLKERKAMPLRAYDFYATECDPLVRSTAFNNIHTTSLPILGKGETHILLKGQEKAGHVSIIERIIPLQVERMCKWIDTHTQPY